MGLMFIGMVQSQKSGVLVRPLNMLYLNTAQAWLAYRVPKPRIVRIADWRTIRTIRGFGTR
eukprot:5709349-Alexandrium_andersonii.AAC.1